MKASDIPTKFNIPFADSAGGSFTRPVPEASQIGIQDGAASLETGFPPDTFLPTGAGGVPPFGQDFNGLFNQVTAWSRWQNAGALVEFDSTFSVAIGGYPMGAIVASASVDGQVWFSTADDNTSDPDAGGADWSSLQTARTIDVTGTSTTYTNAQAGGTVMRSNSGSVMVDTLPGTSPGVLGAGRIITVFNNDASGVLAISAGAGATIFRPEARITYLGPGQSASFGSNGANYFQLLAPTRAKLGASIRIFVSLSGNDDNCGLTSGTALITPQRAWDVISVRFDLAGHVATAKFADGTYTSGFVASPNGQQSRYSSIVFEGNTATPANCIISPASGAAVTVAFGGQVTLSGISCASNNSDAITVTDPGSLLILDRVRVNSFASAAIHATFGAMVDFSGAAVTIAGGGAQALLADFAGLIQLQGATVTASGTPNFSDAFATAADCGVINANAATLQGAATGPRYSAIVNGVINTNGGGPNVFPGNLAGSVSNGGVYV